MRSQPLRLRPSALLTFRRAPDCIKAIGTFNRWLGRTEASIDNNLRFSEGSWLKLGGSPHPRHLREILKISGMLSATFKHSDSLEVE
jgi:hypothetical protein